MTFAAAVRLEQRRDVERPLSRIAVMNRQRPSGAQTGVGEGELEHAPKLDFERSGEDSSIAQQAPLVVDELIVPGLPPEGIAQRVGAVVGALTHESLRDESQPAARRVANVAVVDVPV